MAPQPAPAPRPVTPAVVNPAASGGLGAWNRTLWLIGGALILVVLGVSTVALASEFTQAPATPYAAVSTGKLTPDQVAKKLVGRQFTRDVSPPELSSTTPLRDVFVANSTPGLVGESSTSTADLGVTITYYVFSDPVWAEAYFRDPQIPYGCGVCSNLGPGVAARGLTDRATTYVLYKKTAGGQAWIATTTYVLNGAVVVNALYVPVSNASSYPSAYDLAAPVSYLRPALQLLGSIKS